tara:strand:- start:4068 stop:4292 length:225 start_codon:yes stop_codon:yes gene_type:complete
MPNKYRQRFSRPRLSKKFSYSRNSIMTISISKLKKTIEMELDSLGTEWTNKDRDEIYYKIIDRMVKEENVVFED